MVYFREHRQLHIPHWQRVGSLCASSPAPALPPASRGNMPAGSSPGHPTQTYVGRLVSHQEAGPNYPYIQCSDSAMQVK